MAVMLDPDLLEAVGGLTSFTFVGSVTSAASTINISGTGRQAGDICLLAQMSRNSGGIPGLTLPTDFVGLQDQTGSNTRISLSAKKLDGTEGSLTGMDGTSTDRKIAIVLRPNAAFTSFAWNSPNAEINTANPSAQTIALAGETALCAIAFGQMCETGGAAVSPRTTSPAMNEITGSDTSHYAHWLLQTLGSYANITYDMDDEGTNGIQSGYLTFT